MSLMFVALGTCGQCRLRMVLQYLLISHWKVVLYPALSKPRSIPPMPEKKEATRNPCVPCLGNTLTLVALLDFTLLPFFLIALAMSCLSEFPSTLCRASYSHECHGQSAWQRWFPQPIVDTPMQRNGSHCA